MNEFLSSLKADLLDRRLLPFAAAALALLVAALAYVALAGGSGSTAPSPVPSAGPVPGAGGISVSQANLTTEKAVAETTDGFKNQRKGGSRNPFTPLPGAVATNASAGTSSGTTSGSSGESSPSGSGETEKSGTEESSKKKKSKKSKTVYNVTVLFGSLTPDPTTGEVKLEPFVNLKLFSKLPASGQPLLVFRGVTAGGKAASFTVVGEAILSGEGTCLPSAFQCHLVDLKPGQAEQLEYLAPGATTVSSYELKVVSVESAKAKASSAHIAVVGHAASRGGWQKSRSGFDFLQAAGLMQMPYLRQSSQAGVLVFAPHRHRLVQRGPRLEG